MSTARCDQPVTVPGVFSRTATDIGRRCLRAAGHDGPHRWQRRWEDVPPEAVEADLERESRAWDAEEEEADAPGAD